MRGRYYLKHTINHMVSNSARRKKSYGRKTSSLQTISFYSKAVQTRFNKIEDKINYIKSLNVTEHERKMILIFSNDNALCKACSGKTLDELRKENSNEIKDNFKFLLILLVAIVFIWFIATH